VRTIFDLTNETEMRITGRFNAKMVVISSKDKQKLVSASSLPY
jgi:hypothetical protein